MKSEFGKGLCYNLGLFLAHERVYLHTKESYLKAELSDSLVEGLPEMWFNGAADHLYELQCDSAPKHLRKRLKSFQTKCLAWRLCWKPEQIRATEKDVLWALQEAKDLLRLIDNAHKVPTIKGAWE